MNYKIEVKIKWFGMNLWGKNPNGSSKICDVY